jgi:hypothetical protein
MVQFDANLTGLLDHVRGLARSANESAADPADPAGPAADGGATAAADAATAAGNAGAHSEDDAAAVLVRLVPLLLHHFNAALPDTIRVLSLSRAAKDFNAMRPTWKRYVYTFTPSREEGISLSTWCERVLCPREYRKKVQLLAQATSAGAEPGGGMDQGNAAAAGDNGASFAMSLPPDIAAMNTAAAALVGTHDFAGFQSKGGRKTTTRTVHACNVVETTTAGNGEIGDDTETNHHRVWLSHAHGADHCGDAARGRMWNAHRAGRDACIGHIVAARRWPDPAPCAAMLGLCAL